MAGNVPYNEEKLALLTEWLINVGGIWDLRKVSFILWKSDFDAYARLGKAITGAVYIKDTDFGVPRPARFWHVIAQLRHKGRIPQLTPGIVDRLIGWAVAGYVLVRAVRGTA